MKPVRLADLHELLGSREFGAWWQRWQQASSALVDARLRRADLAAQAELMALRADLAQRAGEEALSRSRDAEGDAARATGPERSLLAAEHAVVARRIRREAERLFAEAEERRGRARQLSADEGAAEREVREGEGREEALRAAARESFGCVPGPSFLYWAHQEDERSAFAVALADGAAGLPVKALEIQVVARQRGVAGLEGPPST